ncbi:MAG: threonylcarbamoyl-AMP synthase [Phycisphaerales bacterium]|nr:threonylcarbamoyl-AMP synthase [Phycisphaerales bacterium]
MTTSTADISRAVDILRGGGVVAFPTETVYGLGADALNLDAVARVFALKGRPSNNPLIVHVSGPEMAGRLVSPGGWSADADALARAFWPGPLSLILPKAETVLSVVTAGGPSVALRSPDHPTALALLYALGKPLVGPSANKSGGVSPTSAEHVRAGFSGEDVHVLDGGPCCVGIESTVLDLTGARPRVLRPGAIAAGDIAMVLGKTVELATGHVHAGSGGAASPGLLARHYAPTTPTHLFSTHQEMWAKLRQCGGPAIVLGLSEPPEAMESDHEWVAMPTSPEGYARAIYATLRAADARGVRTILIERPGLEDGLWGAIVDRLTRASHRG